MMNAEEKKVSLSYASADKERGTVHLAFHFALGGLAFAHGLHKAEIELIQFAINKLRYENLGPIKGDK